MTDFVSIDDIDAEPHAVLFPDTEPKTVRLALSAGESIPPHDHPDRSIVLHLLEGRLRLKFDEESHALTAGDVVRFDGDRLVSPEAIVDSVALLVLAKRSGA